MPIGHRVAKAREAKEAEAAAALADPQTNDEIAEDLIAEATADPPPVAEAAPPAAMTLTMDDVIKLMTAAKGAGQGGFTADDLKTVLTDVLTATAQANAQAMHTVVNRSNPNYIRSGPYYYADGREAIPQYQVYFGPQYTRGKGAPYPRDLWSPDECDLINRFQVGDRKTARGGAWTADCVRNGSTEELIIKAPMTTQDQRSNLPSFALLLRELLEGENAVNPDTLAARVAELERKLAAATAA